MKLFLVYSKGSSMDLGRSYIHILKYTKYTKSVVIPSKYRYVFIIYYDQYATKEKQVKLHFFFLMAEIAQGHQIGSLSFCYNNIGIHYTDIICMSGPIVWDRYIGGYKCFHVSWLCLSYWNFEFKDWWMINSNYTIHEKLMLKITSIWMKGCIQS